MDRFAGRMLRSSTQCLMSSCRHLVGPIQLYCESAWMAGRVEWPSAQAICQKRAFIPTPCGIVGRMQTLGLLRRSQANRRTGGDNDDWGVIGCDGDSRPPSARARKHSTKGSVGSSSRLALDGERRFGASLVRGGVLPGTNRYPRFGSNWLPAFSCMFFMLGSVMSPCFQGLACAVAQLMAEDISVQLTADAAEYLEPSLQV